MTFWQDGERINALLCEMMANYYQLTTTTQWTHLKRRARVVQDLFVAIILGTLDHILWSPAK